MRLAIPLLAAAALLAGATLSSFATAAVPPEPSFSKAYDRCMNAAAGVTVEMHDCINTEYGLQDARLNQAYQAAMARLSDTQKMKLRKIERAWLRTTKNRCDHAGDDNAGGTIQTVEIADCYLSETAKRADALTRYRP